MLEESKSKSKPLASTTHDIYNDKDADLNVISSDGIVFKIHKYYLQAHSAIFRDMLAIQPERNSSNNRLEFIDPQHEDLSTLTIFFNAIYGRPMNLVRDTLGSFRNCIQLARKHECEVLLTTLRVHAARFLPQPISPHYIFIIAAELDDVGLASQAISVPGNWQWPTDKDIPDSPHWQIKHEEEENIKYKDLGLTRGAGVLEISSWPIWELRRIAFSYMIGLMKTGRKI